MDRTVVPSGGRAARQMLDRRAQDALGEQVGRDVSDVAFHTDDAAARASKNLGARAFTVGQHVYFDAGEFRPDTAPGMGLLAHELAHTLQPSTGRPTARRQPRDPAGPRTVPDAPYPEEADILRAAMELAKSGGLVAGATPRAGRPKATVLDPATILVGPLTTDMGPLFYVYRFGGRDPQNQYVVNRASVVPKDWSRDPTADEVERARGGTELHISGPGSVPTRGNTSKQAQWELEFERDHPRLRDVGRGGDPWGATDQGQMTETGVRVPLVSGNTLLRRPFYERRLAAFFSYQGFIHYAELIEAGHDAAALQIAQTLYARTGRQVPLDTELDLWAYTGWSRRAVAARQTVELGLMIAEIAFAIGRLLSLRRPPTPPGGGTPDPAPHSTSPAPTPRPVTPSPGAVRVQITTRAEQIVATSNAAVDAAVRSQNRAFFQSLGMSNSQIRKVLDPTHRLFKAEYGNAMERLVARNFAADPVLSGSVRHIGSQTGHVAGRGKPDFVIDEAAWGSKQFMDVTTRGARQAHVLRDYGKRVLQLVYDIGTFP